MSLFTKNKTTTICLFVSIFSFLSFHGSCSTIDSDAFFKKYPSPIYQDVLIQNEVLSFGTDLCAPRFELIKPILNLYNKPFKLLDLGAAQGYFSFRTAREYPHSFCVMIDANTSYHAYTKHGDMLYDLCLLNSDLKNLCYLNKAMSLSDLAFLNNHEHFDVVFGLLVAHLMYDDLKEQMKVINLLFSLGDNVILEVANEVAVPLTQYVEALSHQMDCVYLGEVRRHYNPNSTSIGKLFWFKTNKKQPDRREENQKSEIKEVIFKKLNGIYPSISQIEYTP